MKKPNTYKYDAGFSLIEVSIVLIIMGLLLAGVLKGQDLIESARTKRVISQINEYKIAISSFIDKYDALPGDFNKASSLIKPNLPNGNGNGIIDGAGLAPGSEALAFWSHLAGADMVGSPGREEEHHIGEFGKGAPETSLGGGITVENHPNGLKGHWFILGKKHGNHGTGGLLTPEQALAIDKKIDTGNPLSGKVRAIDGTDQVARSCVLEGGLYNLENHDKACVLLFQF
jgi:prepilin-type N-terminal cleavage/methylation domain-containing protein